MCRSSLLACFINFALGIHQSYFSVPVFTISTVDRRETNFAAVDEIKNSNALVPRWSCSKVIILNGKRRELEEQWGKKKHTSARSTSKANPLKQLMTACWMSSPRLSRAFKVDCKRPTLRSQNMCILTPLPSLILTSTYKTQKNKKQKINK